MIVLGLSEVEPFQVPAKDRNRTSPFPYGLLCISNVDLQNRPSPARNKKEQGKHLVAPLHHNKRVDLILSKFRM